VWVAELSAADALAELLAGNRRFVEGQPRYGHHVSAAAAANGDQRPIAVVLGCIDSRVPLEAVFDQGFGAICVVRSGGQVLDRAVLGSVEFAITELRVPLVMVLGHSRCGAVQATMDVVHGGGRPAGPLGYLVDEITPAVRAAGDRPTTLAVTRTHVARTVHRLRPLAAGAMLTGAVYDLDSRRVALLG
jgi:carbonic anhydrase